MTALGKRDKNTNRQVRHNDCLFGERCMNYGNYLFGQAAQVIVVIVNREEKKRCYNKLHRDK